MIQCINEVIFLIMLLGFSFRYKSDIFCSKQCKEQRLQQDELGGAWLSFSAHVNSGQNGPKYRGKVFKNFLLKGSKLANFIYFRVIFYNFLYSKYFRIKETHTTEFLYLSYGRIAIQIKPCIKKAYFSLKIIAYYCECKIV